MVSNLKLIPYQVPPRVKERLVAQADCKIMSGTSKISRDGDRITNLDRDAISHILSRLPTRESVRTSILSRAWKNKWTYSYNVDICDDDKYLKNPKTEDDWVKAIQEMFDTTKMVPLINLMDMILHHCEGLKGFRFACVKTVDPSRMQTWISDLCKHNLETFEVICNRSSDIVFPSSLFNSVSLRKLDLRFRACTLNVVSKNCAPNLTSLELRRVDIVNENTKTSTVTFNFPLLETFTAGTCKWSNVKCVEIHAPSLTTFVSWPRGFRKEDYDYSFVLVAPRLNRFECSNGLPETIIMDGSSIVSASFLFGGKLDDFPLYKNKNIGLRVRNLLDKFANLEELELSNFGLKVLQLVPPIRRHDKLRQLELRVYNAEELFQLLRAAPMLKILSMNVFDWVDYDYGAMESIPSCVATHLEEVRFRGFVPETRHYNLAKFFIEKGEKLKRICVDKSSCVELLSTLPKRSACLDIDLCPT